MGFPWELQHWWISEQLNRASVAGQHPPPAGFAHNSPEGIFPAIHGGELYSLFFAKVCRSWNPCSCLFTETRTTGTNCLWSRGTSRQQLCQASTFLRSEAWLDSMHSTLWKLGRLGIMEKLFQQWGLRHELIAAYSYFQLRYKDNKVKLFSAVEDGETVTNSNNLQFGRFSLDSGKQNPREWCSQWTDTQRENVNLPWLGKTWWK